MKKRGRRLLGKNEKMGEERDKKIKGEGENEYSNLLGVIRPKFHN